MFGVAPKISLLNQGKTTRSALESRAEQVLAQIKATPLAVWQWLVMAVLVLWIASSAAHLFWLLMPEPYIVPATVGAVSTGSTQSTPASANVDVGQLKSLMPFGKAAEIAVAPESSLETTASSNIEADATDTNLNLILRGVVASSDKQSARALIAVGDRQANYSIGDKMPEGNNVTLEKILPKRVILKNNGKFESLWLYKDDKNAPFIANPPSVPVVPQRPQVSPAETRNSPSPFQQRSVPSSNEDVNVQQALQEVAAENPSMGDVGSTLSDVVSMSIHRENGQVVGYKIRPGRNVDQFNSLGLKTDDIVTAVNGMPLDNPGQIMEIYRNMSAASSVSLEIKRGESVINVDVELR
jgi:general secretion pathway protein C